MTDFDYIIVGAGMMGAAAARHLSKTEGRVALIGPAEPENRKTHQGVFASHYDEARITRGFDGNSVWGEMALRSIGRYAEIERESGIRFYTEAGCLFSGADPVSDVDYIARALNVAQSLKLDVEKVPEAELPGRFSMLSLPKGHKGYFEARNAGYINPRALVKAQVLLAERQGTHVIRDTAAAVRQISGGAEVQTVSGAILSARKVLVSAGGFTNFANLLPRPVEMAATGRTIVFFELDARRQAEFANMPSTIVLADTDRDSVYILPPVRYPDGKVYLKIGGEGEKAALSSHEDAVSWFQADGNRREVEHLTDIALQLMPGLEGCPTTSGSCVASITPTRYPYIGFTQAPDIAVMTGGNFVAAKSSDEIGRLGAVLLAGGGLGEREFVTQMTPAFL